MTVLVTGATGFLGSHVAEQLSKAGRTARCLVRKTSDKSFLEKLDNIEFAEGTVEDRDSFERAAEGVEAIVHSAGLVKAKTPEEFHRVNADGTRNALWAAKAAGDSLKRFVLVSSQAASKPSEDGTPTKVSDGSAPVTHYGRSKLAAERATLAMKDELPVVILRPSAIYGPRDKEILAFFAAVKAGVFPYMGSPHKRISMVYGADCAAACIRAIDADVPSGSVFFVDDGVGHEMHDLIAQIETVMNKRAWLRFPLPRPVVQTAALASELYGKARGQAVMLTRDKCNELFAPHWVCDSAPTREALGWQPETSFADGTRTTYEWYVANGWL